jgi:hypothetical protein
MRKALSAKVLAFSLAAGAAAAIAAAALAVTNRDGATTATRTIATATTTDFRVVLTARRGSGGGGAPSADVTVHVYGRSGGGWHQTAARPLAGAYFWKTLTGGRAVCRLELRTAAAAHEFEPRALVQLLVTPSLGCGATRSFALADAR